MNYRDLAGGASQLEHQRAQRVVVLNWSVLLCPSDMARNGETTGTGSPMQLSADGRLNLIFTAQTGTPFDVLYNGGNPTVRS